MTAFTSFNASSAASQNIRHIMRDYLALDHIRVWRRLLVARFGFLALVAFVIGRLIPGLSVYGRWVPIALCLVPPIWAVCEEFRLSLRLSHHLGQADARDERPQVHTVVMESDLTSLEL